MSVLEEEAAFKDLPYYKSILKSFLRKQIGALLEEMAAETGEESIIVMANSSTGTTSCLASNNAKCFIEQHTDIQNQFLSYCLSGFPSAVGGEMRTQRPAKRKQKNVPKGIKTPKQAKHSDISSLSANNSDSTILESVQGGSEETGSAMPADNVPEGGPSQQPSLILGVYPDNIEDENLNKSEMNSSVNSELNEPVTNVKEEPLSDTGMINNLTNTCIKTEPLLHTDTFPQGSQSQGSEFSETSFTPSEQSFDSSLTQIVSPGTTPTFGPIRYGFPSALGGELKNPKSDKTNQMNVPKGIKTPKQVKHSDLSSLSANNSDSTISESVLGGSEEAMPEGIPSKPPSLIQEVYLDSIEDEILNKLGLNSSANSEVNESVINVKEEPLSDTRKQTDTFPQGSQGSEFSETNYMPSERSLDTSLKQIERAGATRPFGPIGYDAHISRRLPGKRTVCKYHTRVLKKRKETVYGCAMCNVHLCRGDCHARYHDM
ncbi:uncharacterized protein LOC123527550 isoform X2 [Mercenaria mercenaria]|uniref:uncharacterized protein LOC123527550 isoform X2 n=1 Tax=Mercenaria mercenaria TaxID=6596 RepID=UPI00234ECAD9|nr:uncharacterized protein LOC123527550 isoform X2 [Mercenaria mercenaria]